MGLERPVGRPDREHPSKKVTGFACTRSEVSGRRLWGLFKERFSTADKFFKDHWVHNYNPLLFIENTKIGRNVVPEELPAESISSVNEACDAYLRVLVDEMKIKTVVGVGGYAETRAREALKGYPIQFAKVLHPSPASPVANRGWAEAATRELKAQGVWQ
jgi:single-strand selective monofunctional uracil DNA glycosylase